jgi:hypothetical protein
MTPNDTGTSHDTRGSAGRLRSARVARGRGRRWLFRGWVAATIAVAAYVGLAGPFANADLIGDSYVAYLVPALMILLLGLSLAWLAWFVWGRDERRGRGQGGT